MGMVAAMDEQVGRIRAAIHDNDMDANTLILFASDNGGPEPGRITSNGDLRAGKGTLYEGGVRVCASATWPGVIPAGSTVTAPAHIVDWYATALAVGGASTTQAKPVDGVDLLPMLKGGATPNREELILNIAPRTGAIRSGDWKLVINGGRTIAEDAADPSAELDKPTKLELFNLAQDHQEQHDVAAAHPDIVTRLRARYEELLKIAPAPFGDARPAGFENPKVWGEFPK